jgi:trimeric autotransporter adhesin
MMFTAVCSGRTFVKWASLIAATLLFWRADAGAQAIFTFAGGGTIDGRPATAVALDGPAGIAVDSSGNLFIVETPRHQVRKVVKSTGVIYTIAGTGSAGSAGDGGAATSASLNQPSDVAVDSSGNVFVADSMNHRIRRIDPSGKISTFAGTSSFGFGSDGIPATSSPLMAPSHVATDRSGNVFITENGLRIRRVNSSGIISTIAGNGKNGSEGDGGPATLASFYHARGIAADSRGNVYVADYNNGRVRRVDITSGVITTFAGSIQFGLSGGDGGPATAAVLNGPTDVWVGPRDDVFIAEANGGRIRRVDASSGIITTVAGGECCDRSDGIPASQAYFDIQDVAVDSNGDILIPEDRQDLDKIRKVDAVTTIVSTVAGVSSTSAIGNGDLGPATAALLSLSGTGGAFEIRGLALDAQGNLFIADMFATRIRKVDAKSGFITTVAGGGSVNSGSSGLGALPAGLAVDSAGNIYVADPGYHKIRKIDVATGKVSIFAGLSGSSGGDGKPATQAGIGSVSGVAVDSHDNVYLTDGDSIRKIDAATTIITTVAGSAMNGGYSGDGGPATAAKLSVPLGVSVDAAGNIFVADTFNKRIRRISADGTITTVAGSGIDGGGGDGGPATLAQLSFPSSVVVDANGNLYLTDQNNGRVRKIAPAGIITTLAGMTVFGFGAYSGDGGPATRATFTEPDGLAVTPSGDLFIADGDANRVRVVYACVALGQPQLVTPSNGSAGVPIAPKISWGAVRGAFRYDVLIGTDNPPRTKVAADVTSLSISPSNLDPQKTYYWRVVAKGDPYCPQFSTAASEVHSFTTRSSCLAPGVLGSSGP